MLSDNDVMQFLFCDIILDEACATPFDSFHKTFNIATIHNFLEFS